MDLIRSLRLFSSSTSYKLFCIIENKSTNRIVQQKMLFNNLFNVLLSNPLTLVSLAINWFKCVHDHPYNLQQYSILGKLQLIGQELCIGPQRDLHMWHAPIKTNVTLIYIWHTCFVFHDTFLIAVSTDITRNSHGFWRCIIIMLSLWQCYGHYKFQLQFVQKLHCKFICTKQLKCKFKQTLKFNGIITKKCHGTTILLMI